MKKIISICIFFLVLASGVTAASPSHYNANICKKAIKKEIASSTITKGITKKSIEKIDLGYVCFLASTHVIDLGEDIQGNHWYQVVYTYTCYNFFP